MMPSSSSRSVANRRLEAYARLGVMPDQVRVAPKITHWLKQLDGGVSHAIQLLRGSPDADARKFILVYEDVILSKSQRDLLPIEAFCIAAGISPVRLMEVIVGAAINQGIQMGNLIAALSHPEIVATSVAMAKDPAGLDDREMQLKHANFLPMPKGAQTNINVIANAASQSSAQSAATAPPAEDTIRRLASRFNDAADEQRALPSPRMIDSVPTIMPGVTDSEPELIEAEDD